jgi:branched-chain amino acid transport system ATP-binding protein
MNQASVSLKGIAMSYQITNIFPKLSTFENVRLAVQSRKTAYNLWSKSESDVAVNGKAGDTLKITGLYGKKDVLAGNLSYGDKRRLEIAIAIGSKPILLLMDEPTSGLSPVETNEMVALVKRIAKGLSVILVEHKMKVVMDLSDKITVLHQGRVIARGDPGRIREDETVRRVYLGGVRV